MQIAAFRLAPGADLRQSLLAYCADNDISAAYIASCVGSLRHAVIRYANQAGGTPLPRKLEIVSLVGTVSQDGCHLHIALADDEGTVSGGHLMDGSLVYTTAEIVLGIIPDVSFKREYDQATGYKELRIIRHA